MGNVGPPLTTPAFMVTRDQLSVLQRGQPVLLFFSQPWVIWLNSLQGDVSDTDRLVLLASSGGTVDAESSAEDQLLQQTDQRALVISIVESVMAMIQPNASCSDILSEVLAFLPPAQRNWVDYVMRQAGGIIKLEGETAAFPGLRRSPATPVDTQSALADGSALTGHEVLDEAYDATAWNGKIEVPTKNAVRDVLEGRFPGVVADTIPLAKITGGGTDGSITVNAFGVITAYVKPT